MAGFSSMDAVIASLTSEKAFHADWNKLTAAAGAQSAGAEYWYTVTQGLPTVNALTSGTDLSFQSLCEESDGAIYHGGPVLPDYKFMTAASCIAVASSNTTNYVMNRIVDVLGYIPIASMTTTGDRSLKWSNTFTADSTTEIITHTGYDIASFTRIRLTNTGGALPSPLTINTDYWTVRQSTTTSKLATSYANAVANSTIDILDNGTGTHTLTAGLPRYTTGEGVQVAACATVALGTGTPYTVLTYTNSDGVGSRQTPGSAGAATLPRTWASAPVSGNVYMRIGVGTSGDNQYEYFPLAAGDKGTRSIETFNINVTAGAGSIALLLFKPLVSLPSFYPSSMAERNFLTQMPSMPRIYDGAHLAIIGCPNGNIPASTGFSGHMDFVWG